MTWKRNFLYLVLVGTLFVIFIFISHNEDFASSGVKMRVVGNQPTFRYAGHWLTNTDDINRLSLHSSFAHLKTGNLSRRSQSLYRNTLETLWTEKSSSHTTTPAIVQTQVSNSTVLALKGLLEEKRDDHDENRQSKTTPDISIPVYEVIDRTLQKPGSAVPLSEEYNRTFQWNDRDPEGWKGLPLSVGKTGGKKERVIFNRVGKCGSRSLINLLRDLAQRNHFNLISSVVYNSTHIPKAWEKHIVSVLDELQTPYLYQRHLHYVNFKKNNASEVIYINIIRDPIARMVSHYYYARFGDGQKAAQSKSWKRSPEEYNQTIDECVKYSSHDCTGHKAFYIIPFFCGNFKQCTKPTRWALNRAIYNVQKHFVVVGILEEFDLTLKVLEKMLPRFFTAATELYHTAEMKNSVSRTSTSLKIPPSEETVAILRERMEYEYIFYNYIKTRLHKQRNILGL